MGVVVRGVVVRGIVVMGVVVSGVVVRGVGAPLKIIGYIFLPKPGVPFRSYPFYSCLLCMIYSFNK